MISFIAIGIITITALATYFLSNGFGVALFAGFSITTLAFSGSPLIGSLVDNFGSVETQEYAVIGLFLLFSFVIAYLLREYMTSRRTRSFISRVILAVVTSIVIGGLAIVLLRNVLGVTQVLSIPSSLSSITGGDYAVLYWLVAALLTSYFGAR
jgi:hypothetical protein